VTTILLDISSDESIEKARSDVESRFSKLDVLVVGPIHPCTIPLLIRASEQRRDCLLSRPTGKYVHTREALSHVQHK
jgi:hypothetical protein